MMDKNTKIESDFLDYSDYKFKVFEHFDKDQDISKPILRNADQSFDNLKNILYKTPAFLELLKQRFPKEMLQFDLTSKQQDELAKGTIKFMTRRDGSVLASLVNKDTGKICGHVNLKKVKISPDVTSAMNNYAMQMQIAQIAEEIQKVSIAVEEVREGLEYDRLAIAYSCKQKFLQASCIQNTTLKENALLSIVHDAENSRNMLMESQKVNLDYIKKQPKSFWDKILKGDNNEKIDKRLNEIKSSLDAINMVSIIEALSYQQLGELTAAKCSLEYFGNYLEKSYLNEIEIVERLDSIQDYTKNDVSWMERIPTIYRQIKELPKVIETTDYRKIEE